MERKKRKTSRKAKKMEARKKLWVENGKKFQVRQILSKRSSSCLGECYFPAMKTPMIMRKNASLSAKSQSEVVLHSAQLIPFLKIWTIVKKKMKRDLSVEDPTLRQGTCAPLFVKHGMHFGAMELLNLLAWGCGN